MNFTQIHVKIDIIVIIMNTIKFEKFNNSITTFIYIFVRNKRNYEGFWFALKPK